MVFLFACMTLCPQNAHTLKLSPPHPSPLALQRMAIATALRLAGFDQLLHQWQSAAIVQLRAHAKREALNAAAVAAAKKQEEAQVELATLLNRGRALSKEEAERVQVRSRFLVHVNALFQRRLKMPTFDSSFKRFLAFFRCSIRTHLFGILIYIPLTILYVNRTPHSS